MVTLNLREIFERFDVFEESFLLEPESLSLPTDLGEIKEPIRVFVKIRKDRDGYRVWLNMEGEIELECSRCLTIFRKDISQETEKHIERYPKDENVSLTPDDLEVSFMDELDIVNLEDLVREELILSIPMKPLCRLDCPGVHHHSFLFEENKSPTDPRFAILKDLLTK